MTLNFPANPPLGDIFDPGNGIKYKWDGSQWNQLERILKTIYPIDLDKSETTNKSQMDLSTLSGNKDFIYRFPTTCTTNTLTSELVSTSSADATKLQWKSFVTSQHNYGKGYLYVDHLFPDNNWPNPAINPPPYLYINGTQYVVHDVGNFGGADWLYYLDPYVLDSLLGTEVSISLCDPNDKLSDNEFISGRSTPVSGISIQSLTIDETLVGINSLKQYNDIYLTDKISGKTDTFNINFINPPSNGTVYMYLNTPRITTPPNCYDDGRVFNISFDADVPSGEDEYTHFIDLTTINKI